MQTLLLPFTTSDLSIYSEDKLSTSKYEKLRNDCVALLDDVWHRISIDPDSELVRFNFAKIGEQIEFSTTFLEFLDLNRWLFEQSQGMFNPFPEINSMEQITDFLEFYPETSQITKLGTISLQPKQLFSAFTLQKLANFLKPKLTSFLVSSRDIFIAKGDKPWEFDFEHPLTMEKMKIELRNQSAVVTIRRAEKLRYEDRQISNPFSGIRSPNGVAAVLVEGAEATVARMLGEVCLKITHQYEFNSLAAHWHYGLTLITEDEKIVHYLNNN